MTTGNEKVIVWRPLGDGHLRYYSQYKLLKYGWSLSIGFVDIEAKERRLQMIKFLFEVLQLVVALRLLYAVLKWMVSDKKKSIAYKLYKIITRKIHRKLDAMLQEDTRQHSSKVVAFRKAR